MECSPALCVQIVDYVRGGTEAGTLCASACGATSDSGTAAEEVAVCAVSETRVDAAVLDGAMRPVQVRAKVVRSSMGLWNGDFSIPLAQRMVR